MPVQTLSLVTVLVPRAPFRRTVTVVVSAGSEKQVSRIDAERIVTVVKDV